MLGQGEGEVQHVVAAEGAAPTGWIDVLDAILAAEGLDCCDRTRDNVVEAGIRTFLISSSQCYWYSFLFVKGQLWKGCWAREDASPACNWRVDCQTAIAHGS
jgi:hypothetical protein